jgi:ribosome-associated toxin RatA of RatAB toxin-antitoxin module
MQTASSTLVVDAPIERVWALIADLRTVRDYNPSVKSVDILTTSPTGLGAIRRCHFHDGTDVLEEVVTSDSGARLRLVLSEYALPMKRLESEFSLVTTAGDRTEVTFSIHYEMKLGILGQALSAIVVNGKLVKTTATMLAGLAHHLATGETVEPGFKAA